MTRLLLACALMLLFGPVAVVTQDRDAPARPAAQGVIRGRVVAADTGRPVALARVRATGGRAGDVTATDLSGSFRLTGLPTGHYVVTASKEGAFLDTQYGQTHPDLPGRVVAVSDGREATIEIAMMRPGVISGRVVDEAGDPLPQVTVLAIRQQTPSGESVYLPNGGAGVTTKITQVGRYTLRTRGGDDSTRTNDRGEYRLFGLEPGRYLVTAMLGGNLAPVLWFNRAAMSADKPEQARRLAAIYFPGVTDPAAATRLEIGPGREIANTDFAFRIVPTLMISGIAVGPDDQPLSGGSVSLYVSGTDGLAGLTQVGTIQKDGTFRVEALAGRYTLRARHSLRGAPGSSWYGADLSVAVPVAVGETDITGLYVKLTYGATLQGRMVFEGSAPPPPSDTAFRVSVESGAPGAMVSAPRNADDAFVLSGIESGSRRLMTISPAAWIPKAIYIGGRNVADLPVEFADGITVDNATVVFTTVRSPLSVEVQHAAPNAQAAIAVFPRDPAMRHARSARIQFRPAGRDPVAIEMLPPGEYLVAAIADVAASSIRNADTSLLERLAPFAEPVRLVEGTTTSVRVRPVALPN